MLLWHYKVVVFKYQLFILKCFRNQCVKYRNYRVLKWPPKEKPESDKGVTCMFVDDFSLSLQEIIYNIDPLFKKKGKSVSTIFDTSVQAALRYGDYKILTGDPGYDQWVPEPTSPRCKHFFLKAWVK